MILFPKIYVFIQKKFMPNSEYGISGDKSTIKDGES